MKKLLKSTWCFIISIILVVSLFSTTYTFVAFAEDTIYYVDSVSGDDDNNGTSTETPWQSLTKVNAQTFEPGDQILFKCGCSWTGTLEPSGSGDYGQYITFGKYSTGNLPVINGNGAQAAIKLVNACFYIIENLKVTNSAVSQAKRNGILLYSPSGTYYVTIRNCEVTDVDGVSEWGTDKWYSAAIQMDGYDDGEISGVFAAIIIEDNNIHDVYGGGIFLSPGAGANIISVLNNSITDTGCDAIWLNAVVADTLVESNICDGAGVNGDRADLNAIGAIFNTGSGSSIFQYNEAMRTVRPNTGYDGQAFDADLDLYGTQIWQYNYSHDNEGGFFLACEQTNANLVTIKVRYNISLFDHQGSIRINDPLVHVYNNTVYNPDGTIEIYYNQDNSGAVLNNNIFYANSSSTFEDNFTYDYNSYYGGMTPPTDTHRVISDPDFVDPAASPGPDGRLNEDVEGFMLNSNSPCIDAGTDITSDGGYDYWGNTTKTGTTDIGATESLSGGTKMWDPLNNWDNIYSKSTSWTLDTANVSRYDGDASRARRTTLATKYIKYYDANEIVNYYIIIYTADASADTSKIKIYTSPNNSTYTLNTATVTTWVSGTGWHGRNYQPTAALPAGTKYIKIELSSTTGYYWDTQIGLVGITAGS